MEPGEGEHPHDLETFLDADSELRSRFGVSPVEVEARFGLGGDSWDGAVWTMDDGSRIGFRGLIDRVDISPDGSSALVLDYKTGSKRPYEGLESDPIDRGQRLQLAVYSLAAQGRLGPDTDVRAAYWFTTTRGDFTLVPNQPIRIDEDTGKTVRGGHLDHRVGHRGRPVSGQSRRPGLAERIRELRLLRLRLAVSVQKRKDMGERELQPPSKGLRRIVGRRVARRSRVQSVVPRDMQES